MRKSPIHPADGDHPRPDDPALPKGGMRDLTPTLRTIAAAKNPAYRVRRVTNVMPCCVFYLIEKAQLNGMPTAAVLDMLRFDRAVIESNPPTGFYLLSNADGPDVERWRSFGVTIAAFAKGVERDIPYELIQYAHRKKPS